jgi:hypothetical protein
LNQVLIIMIAKQNFAIWVGEIGALRFLEASPPRSAFTEILVAGFAAGKPGWELKGSLCGGARRRVDGRLHGQK